METFGALLILMLLVAGNAAAFLFLSWYLGPRSTASRGEVYNTPFETGVTPDKIVRGHLSIRFFLVALLFILFDVELVFLFPWAVVYRELGWFGFGEMLVFLSVVLAGLYYSVKKGALEWD